MTISDDEQVIEDLKRTVWKLEEELEAYKAVAEAARTGRGLDDALDALDALKEAGREA